MKGVHMLISIILIYGVLLINGYTDAPNSIATVIFSKAMSYKKAILLSSICNLLGAVIGCFIDTSVAEFVFSFGNFGSYASYAICISLLVMILFGWILSFFGIPTSESHAMLASLAGTAFCLSNDGGVLKKLGHVFVFAVFSCALSFFISYLIRLILKKNLRYNKLQGLFCALNSFMHGYQGGMKYLGILCFLLSINLSSKRPTLLSLSVGIVLMLGTLMCGKKILKLVGSDIVKITDKIAFSSDIGTYFSLFICSMLGMPVSTGDIKCLSIMGSGIAEKQKLNKKTAIKLLISFAAVFPICFIFGYFLMKLFV